MPSVYDPLGRRKYLTVRERGAFLTAAKKLKSHSASAFCATLAHTGARISEVLELSPSRIDLENRIIMVRSLKKRRGGVYRAIPVPPDLLRELNLVHSVSAMQPDDKETPERLWPWGRTAGWQIVKKVMSFAHIHGPQATPKGLRHGFAIAAIQAGVPLNIVQKWLGHSRLETTAIYADAVGEEERAFAKKMWSDFSSSM